MLQTNSQFLFAEIMDVVRLFEAENDNFTHYFSYGNDTFFNSIEYEGAFYDSEDKQKVEDEIEYKRYARRFAKLAFYNLLSGAKGVKMPYGALTGIRPTKLAYAEIDAGRDPKELFDLMQVSQENVQLIERVLTSQKKIYANKGGQDVFVSLPFCPTKCEYCSFITAPITATKGYVDDYITCLAKEIDSIKPLLTNPKSIYIGGGTPFVIETSQLERVYKAIDSLKLPPVEYTVEAGRPDVFSEDKLKLTKDFGVTRICINPQSFSDKTLQAIGRKHTERQVYEAFEMAEKYGFDINLDLIAGLTGETLDEFSLSLDKAIALNPANITVHTLSLKSGARLKENCYRLQIDDIGRMVALSREKLTNAGYEPYYMYRQKYQAGGHENCGWAKRGKECVYNIDVMEEIADNVAVGANAISKRLFADEGRIERSDSPKDIKTYLTKVDKVIADRLQLFRG